MREVRCAIRVEACDVWCSSRAYPGDGHVGGGAPVGEASQPRQVRLCVERCGVGAVRERATARV